MTSAYADIIHLVHHVSPNRKRMSRLDRAAQFSPFAALTGYDDAIRETGRLTDSPDELADDAAGQLDEKLRFLAEHLEEAPVVTVTHFVPDGRKQGGAYVKTQGVLRRLDPISGNLMFRDGTGIPIARIYDVESALLEKLYAQQEIT